MKLLEITQKLFGLRKRPMSQTRAKEILGKLKEVKQPNKWLGGERRWL